MKNLKKFKKNIVEDQDAQKIISSNKKKKPILKEDIKFKKRPLHSYYEEE